MSFSRFHALSFKAARNFRRPLSDGSLVRYQLLLALLYHHATSRAFAGSFFGSPPIGGLFFPAVALLGLLAVSRCKPLEAEPKTCLLLKWAGSGYNASGCYGLQVVGSTECGASHIESRIL